MKKTLYILGMAVATSFASCQKSDVNTPVADGSNEVTFTSRISTRATGTSWDDGDEIGVFMYLNTETDVWPNSENAHYTTSGDANATFTSINPLVYPSSDLMDFVAYYPYTSDASSGVIKINTSDQSSDEKIKAQDFMMAASDRPYAIYDLPKLSFTRKMSKIVVNVTLRESAADLAISDISLSDIVTTGTLLVNNTDKATANVEAGATRSDISLFLDETRSTIEAIIIPQETSTTLSLTIGGRILFATIEETFEENKLYNYNLAIGYDKLELIQATINDWEDTDNGTVYPEEKGLKASEISMDNIPEDLTWIITDTELDEYKTANLKNVLSSLGSGAEVTIVLPNATTIKFTAFYSMPHITTVYMPQVTTTEDSIFSRSKSLRSVYMPKKTTITSQAFNYTGFTSFDFTGITKIEEFAFSGCTNLAEISNLSGATIGDSAFSNCCALSSFDFTGVTEIELGAFRGCTNLTEVSNISFATIPVRAFKDCGLTSFDFTGITEIGPTSFFGCSNLAEVSNISFATIPDDAFCMSGLTSFDFTNITHIGNTAFGLCQNLKNVELPSTVVSIGNQAFAFSGCTTLTVHWSGETILTYDATWFSEAPLATINIPAGTTADYVTKGWPEALLVEQAQ